MKTKQIVIIDYGGSMDAWDNMINSYVQENYPDADKYFMYNCIGEYLFKGKSFTDFRRAEDVRNELSRHHPNNVQIVIISDAGCGRDGNSDKRFRASLRDTLLFSYKVFGEDEFDYERHEYDLLWVNPHPEYNWENTTAQRIGRNVEMVCISEKTPPAPPSPKTTSQLLPLRKIQEYSNKQLDNLIFLKELVKTQGLKAIKKDSLFEIANNLKINNLSKNKLYEDTLMISDLLNSGITRPVSPSAICIEEDVVDFLTKKYESINKKKQSNSNLCRKRFCH